MTAEIEVYDKGDWQQLGFHTLGGFNAYRYASRADAKAAIEKLYPDKSVGSYRLVDAKDVTK